VVKFFGKSIDIYKTNNSWAYQHVSKNLRCVYVSRICMILTFIRTDRLCCDVIIDFPYYQIPVTQLVAMRTRNLVIFLKYR